MRISCGKGERQPFRGSDTKSTFLCPFYVLVHFILLVTLEDGRYHYLRVIQRETTTVADRRVVVKSWNMSKNAGCPSSGSDPTTAGFVISAKESLSHPSESVSSTTIMMIMIPAKGHGIVLRMKWDNPSKVLSTLPHKGNLSVNVSCLYDSYLGADDQIATLILEERETQPGTMERSLYVKISSF